MKSNTTKNRNTGLRHSEIRPHDDKWVLSYCYHGSSFVHSKSFADLKEAQAEMETLRALSKKTI